MLDIINFITLLGAVQGVFFGLLLLGLPTGNRLANRLLATFLLLFSLSMIGIIAYSSGWVLQVPHLGLLHTPLAAINGAPLYLYFLALTHKDFRMKPRHWCLFLPAVAVALWLVPFFVLPAGAKRAILEASYTVLPLSWKISFVFSVLTTAFFIAASYVLIVRHERVIREVYSSPLNKTLLWARHFLYAGTGIFAVCVLVSLFSFSLADPVSNLLFSVNIYVFGYRAIRQPAIFTEVAEDALPEMDDLALVHRTSKYEKSGLTEAKARVLLDKLDGLMQEAKIYLDPTLNLQQLAERLDLPPHQLSQLLNQFQGESFSDYINRYRVEHFKRAVADPANAHLSLLAIAFDAGFNSKAAFNAAFKKMTGQTPSAFKENSLF